MNTTRNKTITINHPPHLPVSSKAAPQPKRSAASPRTVRRCRTAPGCSLSTFRAIYTSWPENALSPTMQQKDKPTITEMSLFQLISVIMVLLYQIFTIFAVNLTKELTREPTDFSIIRQFHIYSRYFMTAFSREVVFLCKTRVVTYLPKGSPRSP